MAPSKACSLMAYSCVCLMLVATVSARPGLNIGDLISSIVKPVVEDAYKSTDITLFDHYCVLTRSPYIKRLEVHYRAELKCPGWTPIKGKGDDHTNPSNSESDAIKDFVVQALSKGLVTEEEAREWI